MENKEIYGRIYLIINLINNKQYIGQTVETIEERFCNHCSCKTQVISKAIKKYGKENFSVKEIDIAYNQEELNFLEGLYMKEYNSLVPNGYNVKEIIDGKGRHSKETIEKLKIAANKPERLKNTKALGIKNQGRKRNNLLKFTGVSFCKDRYLSQIIFNNKKIRLGSYLKLSDAAKAYDIKAIELYGNNCNLNFPELREDYINCKIIIKKIAKHHTSKSKEKGIWFNKTSNRWIFSWLDKKINKNKSKKFKLLEDAINFKYSKNYET